MAPETFEWRLRNRGCIFLQRETVEDCCSERVVGDLDTGDVVVFGRECRARCEQRSLWWLSFVTGIALLRAGFGCLQAR
jgi:hypothetical protein